MNCFSIFGRPFGLVPAAVVLLALGCADKHPKPVKTPPPVVEVAFPIPRKVTDFQIYTARTQAVESVDIKARVTGYLVEICFKDGDEVKKDKVLFKIDDRPYKASLDKAKADVEYSKASLVKAQALYDIGLQVQKNEKGAISEQEIKARLGARDEAAASVKQFQAALETAQLNFDWCTVTAPISGLANRHFVDVGNLVSQDTTVLTNIVAFKPIWAYFDVDENTAQRVHKLILEGKFPSARTDTAPAQMGIGIQKGFPIDGSIDFVSNQLDPSTGSIRLRAVFPNEKGLLLAGMFGRVRIPVSEDYDALLIDDRAVGTNQGKKFVLVVDKDNKVEYREVEVGQLHDGLRAVKGTREIIESGPDGKQTSRQVPVLNKEDRIVVEGLQRIRPGTEVEPKTVEMDSFLEKPRAGAAPSGAKPAQKQEDKGKK